MSSGARPLSASERVLFWLDAAMPLNFTTIGRFRGGVDAALLNRAARALQARHPLLRVRIDPGPLAFVDTDAAAVVRVAEGAGVAAEVERELATPFDTATGPLVRLAWIPADDGGLHTLLVTLHHTVGDGKSGIFAARDLLASAGGGGAALPGLAPLAPMESRFRPLARGVEGWARRLSFLATQAAGNVWPGTPRCLHAPPLPPIPERRVTFVAVERDAAWVDTLTERCRAEQTTVHGVLLAATALELAATTSGSAHAMVPILTGTPIDLRERLVPPSGEDIGLTVSMHPVHRRVRGGGDLWTFARDLKDSIHRAKESDATQATLGALPLAALLLGGARRPALEFGAAWESAMQSSTGLTNLGRLDAFVPTRLGALELDALHFGVNPSVLGTFVTSATSLNGRLFWDFQYVTPPATRAEAEALTDRVVARVDAAVGATAAPAVDSR